MTRVDTKIETCPCQVCRSDLAYVIPCDYRDAIEFEIIGEAPAGDYEIVTPIAED
jgi:hypothetical protein